jgi:hypothetical protein
MISGVRVFEYTFQGSSLPSLVPGNPKRPIGSSVWTCPKDLAPVGNRQVATLHIYDEPGKDMTLEEAQRHNRDEFEKSTRLLGEPFILVKNPHAVRPAPASQPDVHSLGVLEAETAALGRRQDFILDLQFKQRSGQNRPGSVPGGGGGQICGPGNAQLR